MARWRYLLMRLAWLAVMTTGTTTWLANLLVEEHADEQRERVVGQQAVGVVVARYVECHVYMVASPSAFAG